MIHLYHSTSTLQRRVVFGLDRAGIRDIAVRDIDRTREVAEFCNRLPVHAGIWQRFVAEYLERWDPIELLSYCACEPLFDCERPAERDRFDPRERPAGQHERRGPALESQSVAYGRQSAEYGKQLVEFRILFEGNEKCIRGVGNGPIDAFVDALDRGIGQGERIVDFSEHAVREGADAAAIAYVEVDAGGGRTLFGVGRHASSTTACLAAVVAAANRLRSDGQTSGSE